MAIVTEATVVLLNYDDLTTEGKEKRISEITLNDLNGIARSLVKDNTIVAFVNAHGASKILKNRLFSTGNVFTPKNEQNG